MTLPQDLVQIHPKHNRTKTNTTSQFRNTSSHFSSIDSNAIDTRKLVIVLENERKREEVNSVQPEITTTTVRNVNESDATQSFRMKQQQKQIVVLKQTGIE